MPPRPFVNDGLWRCLCPGFPPSAATRATTAGTARLPRRSARPKDGLTYPRRQLRAYTGSKSWLTAGDSFFSQPGSAPIGFRPFREQPHPPPSFTSRNRLSLTQLPTRILYEHVRAEGARGNWTEVMNICRVLVKDRGEQPNREMYTALLHSFVDCKEGTAGKVRKVLEEMGFWHERDALDSEYPKIELDGRACECVLEVLAVHPDYLLRSDILEYMKSRWLPLSARGQNYVVAGLLRERHFEQALDMMEDMVKNNTRVENWVLDVAMWILLEFKEVEEAFYVLGLKETMQSKSSVAGAVRVSDALWGALLDAAAQRQLVSVVSRTHGSMLMRHSMERLPKCGCPKSSQATSSRAMGRVWLSWPSLLNTEISNWQPMCSACLRIGKPSSQPTTTNSLFRPISRPMISRRRSPSSSSWSTPISRWTREHASHCLNF